MAARNTKGVQICVVKDGVTALTITPTAVSKAKPATVTAANTLANGDLVKLASDSTGLSEIDGKVWVVDNVSGTGFDLVGSDTTAATGTFAAGTAIDGYPATDMQCLCLGSFSIAQATGGGDNNISVATFCDPTATVPSPIPAGATGGGSFSFTGYIDTTAADYPVLLDLVESGDATIMRITLPQHGYIVAPTVFTELTWDVPVDGAMGYSGSGTFSSKPRHIW